MCAGVELPGITAQPLARAHANSTALTVMPRSRAMLATALSMSDFVFIPTKTLKSAFISVRMSMLMAVLLSLLISVFLAVYISALISLSMALLNSAFISVVMSVPTAVLARILMAVSSLFSRLFAVRSHSVLKAVAISIVIKT